MTRHIISGYDLRRECRGEDLMRTAQIKAPNAIDIEVGRRIDSAARCWASRKAHCAGSCRLQTVARFLDIPILYFFDDL